METNFKYKEELDFIRDHIPSWKNINVQEEIIFEKFLYGHSREVYKVTTNNENANPKKLILRKFKVGDPKENYVFDGLSSAGMAAKFYGSSSKYRIEEYLVSRNITSSEINKKSIRRKLALQLGALHKVKLDKLEKTNSFFEKKLDNDIFVQTFLKQCDIQTYTPDQTPIIKELRSLGSSDEIAFIKKVIQQYPLVFSHNDIWVGNILIMENNLDVLLIDYEMVDYNFPGYDIGKILLEAVFDRPRPFSPYHELREEMFPSDDDFKDFIRYYVISNKIGLLDKDEENKLIDESTGLLLDYERKLFPSEMDHQNLLEDLFKQSKVGIMVSTCYCTMLGIILGKAFSDELDFVQFALDNYKYYKLFKPEAMQNLSL